MAKVRTTPAHQGSSYITRRIAKLRFELEDPTAVGFPVARHHPPADWSENQLLAELGRLETEMEHLDARLDAGTIAKRAAVAAPTQTPNPHRSVRPPITASPPRVAKRDTMPVPKLKPVPRFTGPTEEELGDAKVEAMLGLRPGTLALMDGVEAYEPATKSFRYENGVSPRAEDVRKHLGLPEPKGATR